MRRGARTSDRAAGSDTWMSLGDAADYLGVHESTLRRWADAGRIECRRTAGGHRRFSRAVLDRSAGGSTGPQRRGDGRIGDETWYAGLARTGALDACRTLGQRLAGVVAQFMLSADPSRQLDEARDIGRSYGRLCRESGLALTSGIEAYLFHRDRLLDMVGSGADGSLDPLARYDHVLGEVLIGFAEEASEVLATQ